jgi:branched-chain amino acid transport system substrate-binding protein
MRSHRARFLSITATAAVMAALAAGCSSSSNGSTGGTTGGSGGSKSPIVIGTSLSLTGDFSADGQAFQKGYNLWVSQMNAKGGIDGHPLKLVVLNDASSPTQVATNYQKLITVNHVNLTFGPFSSLLTAPASSVAHRYGYAFVEGAGGGQVVFAAKLNNVFDVSLPVTNELDPFAAWMKSLPASQRPKTAAYPITNDPFAMPATLRSAGQMKALGIKTLYQKIFPAEVAAYKSGADGVAATKAQMVVLGSTDVPTVSAFMSAFEQQHYNPKIFLAVAGPDQGAAFLSAVGKANATGIMVPNAWYPGAPNALSQAMVKAYVAKYGGNASGINADVAEAFSVGEVVDQAITATHSAGLSSAQMNAKIIAYLHSPVTLTSVQGSVHFNSVGENLKATAFIFQWQNGKFVQVLPLASPGSVKIINPKPAWGK